MWCFLLLADLYFLSVGIRSMIIYGFEPVNIVMVLAFLVIAVVIVLNILSEIKRRDG